MIAKNNLKKARENLRISTIKLAELVSTNHQNITRWELHQRKLPIEWATKIAPHLNTTVSQLLGLEELNTDSNINKESFTEEPIKTAEDYRKAIYAKKDSLTREVSMFHQDFSCGPGTAPLDYVNSTSFNLDVKLIKELTSSTNSIVIVKAKGDSMFPTINDKDLVLVDTSVNKIRNSSKSHNIYAFRHEDRLCLKKLSFSKNNKQIIIAESLNNTEENKPFEIKLDDITDFCIIGKVIANIRKFGC